MDRLQALENKSIYILREAYASFRHLCMLWSIGKDSTVLLHLARKAFAGYVPFPLVHIDTHYKIPQMIDYRDQVAMRLGLTMLVGTNEKALNAHQTYPDGNADHLTCCRRLKTEALLATLDGSGVRKRLDLATGQYEEDADRTPFEAAIVGARSDEEGSRSKERYFSPRGEDSRWDVEHQPPEIWNQYKTDYRPGTSVRVHPLLDWTELDIWQYIDREHIEVVPLYYDQGEGTRYRSLGCAPCTKPIRSTAKCAADVVAELQTGCLAGIAERSGREQDKEDGGGLESLRRKGYM